MVLPGTKDIGYENIGYTGSNYATAGCALEKVSLTAGKYVNLGATFAKGNKDSPLYLSRASTYEMEIRFAGSVNVVLYDVVDRRGWLMDGANALLHLACKRLSLLSCDPIIPAPLLKLSNFQYAKANPADGKKVAASALMDPQNRSLPIFEEIETWEETTLTDRNSAEKVERKTIKKEWCFQDLVRETWRILEQIHDHQVQLLSAPGVGLRGTDRDKLEGFGFRDIAQGDYPLRPRVAILKSSGRGWVDFTKNIRAITLLGQGFGELIKPVRDSNTLCRLWKQVPTGQDYLVARISTLDEICERSGNKVSDPLELAQGIYWHKGAKLFEPCSGCNKNGWSATCDRIQVLLPPSLGHKTHPKPFSKPEGAAVFGRSAKYCWRWGNHGEPAEGEQDEQATEDDATLQDSSIGTSISTEPSRTAPSSKTASTSRGSRWTYWRKFL